MKATTKLTTQQSAEIRNLVDLYGWEAVRQHPVLGPIWRAVLADQKRYENRIDT